MSKKDEPNVWDDLKPGSLRRHVFSSFDDESNEEKKIEIKFRFFNANKIDEFEKTFHDTRLCGIQ